jgi:hypothetical protein
MYVESNIYPMYFVLERYPKPINVLTDTTMSILTLSSNKLLITLHSFLTFFRNKACNPDVKGNGNCNGNGNGNLLIQINSLL